METDFKRSPAELHEPESMAGFEPATSSLNGITSFLRPYLEA